MTPANVTPTPAAAPQRNVAFDVFRGLALITILINHIPWNPFYWATPSRFGFSDATDIFVFISGYVAALAYVRSFNTQGWLAGCRRVFTRWSQIYAAHLLMFALLVSLCLAGNAAPIGPDYIKALNLHPAFNDPHWALTGFATLRYVPNYFDMLPMYLVLMVMMPFFILTAKISRLLALALPVLIYAGASFFAWELQADSTTARPWFFNPFYWQLLFFTGFALGAGYLPRPKPHTLLLLLAGMLALGAAVIEYGATFFEVPLLGDWRLALAPYTDKSHLGLLRFAHFLALAYLASRAVTRWPALLRYLPARLAALIGRNALTTFVASMALSFVAGMALDYWGREMTAVTIINAAAVASLLAIAWSANMLCQFLRKTAADGPLAAARGATS